MLYIDRNSVLYLIHVFYTDDASCAAERMLCFLRLVTVFVFITQSFKFSGKQIDYVSGFFVSAS